MPTCVVLGPLRLSKHGFILHLRGARATPASQDPRQSLCELSAGFFCTLTLPSTMLSDTLLSRVNIKDRGLRHFPLVSAHELHGSGHVHYQVKPEDPDELQLERARGMYSTEPR